MNEVDLNGILQRAALAKTDAILPIVDSTFIERLRGDTGRALRWRFFGRWLLILSALSALSTAVIVCWSIASKDKTHSTPPTMSLFREIPPK